MSDVPSDWFDGFFEDEYLEYLSLGPPEWTEATVAFLVEHLDLSEGTQVLDLACGRGRVSIPLAKHGCAVTGLDLSPRSLEIARRDADAAGVELTLVHRDMRDLDAVEAFDVVVNLYTSFGYFQDPADHERVLAAVARSLVPGGTFLIETINPISLAARFRERDWRELDGGVLLLEHRDWDHATGRCATTWTFIRPDGTRSELAFTHRMHTAAELIAMLDAAGLHVDETWGGWDAAPLGEGHRIILRAHR